MDTSWGFSLALEEEPGQLLLREQLTAVGRESDRLLIPWLVQCLEKAGAALQEVKRWTLGIGPGSFAGLRCGIAAAKGAALASGAVLRGVPSAYALARAVPGEPSSVGVLHDGRCGEVLLTRFLRQEGGILRMQGEPAPWKPAQLEEPERLCQAYGLLQPELADFCPASLRERISVLPRLPAEELLQAPESLYPWPRDLQEQERSVEPLYVRQAVFVKPAALRTPL
ncbi:MAG: tRNA (adenosine(37)-N6)-threonylcarbamoyltransferase complex dimerization subunit type 1 TsaB [Oligosphaeraceae bacterium]